MLLEKKKMPIHELFKTFASLLTFSGNLILYGKLLHDETTLVIIED